MYAKSRAMSSTTPIRVRGKKTAKQDEKWNARRQRKLHKYAASSGRSSSVTSLSHHLETPRRPKKRRTQSLAGLEQLPTELIQTIFLYCANPDLPISSPHLASQLNSRHLYHEITSRVIEKVIFDKPASDRELANVSRLMNSKFFTWQFFHTWLDAEGEIRNMDPSRWTGQTWLRMLPHKRILPPKKLLNGPFTDDKIKFLDVLTMAGEFASLPSGYIDWIPPLYHELAKQSAVQAVAERCGYALSTLFQFGVKPDTDLLRFAVMDEGCDEHVVGTILRSVESVANDIDLLDRAIWSWAEKARSEGNEKGRWLIRSLKEAMQ